MFPYQIARPATGLLAEALQVLARQPDAEQNHADQKEQDTEQGEHTFDLGSDDQAPNSQQDGKDKGSQREPNTCQGEESQGRQGEAGQQLEGESDGLIKGILGLTRCRRRVFDLDLDGIGGIAISQGWDEGVDLTRGEDRVHDLVVAGTQQRARIRHPDLGDTPAQAIHGPGYQSPPPLMPAAKATHAVVPSVQFGQESGYRGGGILRIRVQGHYPVASGDLEPRQDGRMPACVAARQEYSGDIRAQLVLLAQKGRGAIPTASVDKHRLVGDAETIEHRIEPIEQVCQYRLVVGDGDDYRKLDAGSFVLGFVQIIHLPIISPRFSGLGRCIAMLSTSASVEIDPSL